MNSRFRVLLFVDVRRNLNMKYKKIVLKARFDVIPKLSDFELLDQEVSEDLKENGSGTVKMCSNV